MVFSFFTWSYGYAPWLGADLQRGGTLRGQGPQAGRRGCEGMALHQELAGRKLLGGPDAHLLGAAGVALTAYQADRGTPPCPAMYPPSSKGLKPLC